MALSQVPMMNGFEHDLKRVCAVAHSRGALLSADIVQATRAMGVDFFPAASYNRLIGDFAYEDAHEQLGARLIEALQ